MPKLVNGVIVPDGEASGGSSSSSSGSNNAKKFLTQPVRLGSRSVPLYALLGVVVLVGGVVAGPKGAFYVLVAAAIVFALKHCNQRSASSSSSSSSSSSLVLISDDSLLRGDAPV